MTGIKQFRAAVIAVAAMGLMGSSPAQRSTASQSLTIVDVYCTSNGASPGGDGTGTCSATVTGGTGIYTYSWEPEPESAGISYARIPCLLESYRNVILTVTDSNGATATFSTRFFCGRAD